jgi:hypothetical protein
MAAEPSEHVKRTAKRYVRLRTSVVELEHSCPGASAEVGLFFRELHEIRLGDKGAPIEVGRKRPS